MTIASIIRSGISRGLSTDAILAEVRAARPSANTTAACVAYYRTEARRLARGGSLVAPRVRAPVNVDLDRFLNDDGSVMSALADRAFGIEVEFHGNGRDLRDFADALRAALPLESVVIRGYCHSDGSAWDLKTDGSCEYELATPRLTRADWPKFEAAMAALKSMGATVREDCGVHVHHELRDARGRRPTWETLRAIVRTWAAFDEPIHNALPASRRANRYCNRLYASTAFSHRLDDAAGLRQSVRQMGRYMSLNAMNWWRSGRIEIRAHHGSLSAEKIGRWVAMTQRILGAALKDAAATEQALAGAAGWTTRERWTRFTRLLAGPGNLARTAREWVATRCPDYDALIPAEA